MKPSIEVEMGDDQVRKKEERKFEAQSSKRRFRLVKLEVKGGCRQ
jgi:hypothetical protein